MGIPPINNNLAIVFFMKTPKRKKPCGEFSPQHYTWEGPNDDAWRAQRWKRKNRIAQLKRTIARLTKELAAARESCDYLYTAYIENERCARQLYEYIMSERKNTHKTAESGQQTELPTTGGQQDRKEQNK